MTGIIKPRREKIKVGFLNNMEEPEHAHQEIELLFVVKGKLAVDLDESQILLEPNQLYLINSNTRHRLQGEKGGLYLQVLIAYDLVRDIVGNDQFLFHYQADNLEGHLSLLKAIHRLLRYYLDTSYKNDINFGYLSICYHILDVLAHYFLVEESIKFENLDIDRKKEIIAYLDTHFQESITLESLSDYLYLSPPYVSKYFKRTFGVNFKRYLTNLRLEHACEELIYTEKRLTAIALDNGFVNTTVFTTKFKEYYGVSPLKFRELTPDTQSGVQKLTSKQLELVEDYLQNAEVQSNALRIEIPVSQGRLLKQSWKDMINVGVADSLLQSEVRDHVQDLKENLGFDYVRIWNLFSRELLIDFDNREMSFNFTKIDYIFDFLVKHHIKPHIELTYKDRVISRNCQDSLTVQQGYSYASVANFKRILTSFLKHCVVRYGLSEVENWRFELSFHEWFLGPEHKLMDYFKWFNALAEVRQNFSNKIRIGGCGCFSVETLKINQRILELWTFNTYQPDFLTLMNYAYDMRKENGELLSIRSRNNQFLKKGISRFRKFLSLLGWQDKPLFVTEWNLTISDRNFLNDTAFKGCYLLENIFENLNRIDSLAYYASGDHSSEYYDTGNLLFGGLGLVSHSFIYKPVAYAYQFLNRLDDYVIAQTKNYILTTDRKDNYTLLYQNKIDLSGKYFTTDEDKLDLTQLETYFTSVETSKKSIILQHIKTGKYRVKINRVSEEQGSLLKEWEQINQFGDLSLKDLEYLKSITIPKLVISEIETFDNTIKLELLLNPNEFILIKIKRI